MIRVCFPSSFDDRLIGSPKFAYFLDTETTAFYDLFSGRLLKRFIGRRPIISHVAHWEWIAFTGPLRRLNFSSDFANCKKLMLPDNKPTFFESLTTQSRIKRFTILDVPTQHTPTSLAASENYFFISYSYAHYSRAQFCRRKTGCFIQFPRNVFAPIASDYKFLTFSHSTIISSKSWRIARREDKTKLFRTKKVYNRICRLFDNSWCAREDLNLHALAGTSPSCWRVYHFTTRAGELE